MSGICDFIRSNVETAASFPICCADEMPFTESKVNGIAAGLLFGTVFTVRGCLNLRRGIIKLDSTSFCYALMQTCGGIVLLAGSLVFLAGDKSPILSDAENMDGIMRRAT